MLKILQARLQQYVNQELADVQTKFRLRNQRTNSQHPLDYWKSKKMQEKHLLLLHYAKAFDCVDQKKTMESS